MKKNILIKGAMSLLLVGTLASCSSDYLQTDPLSSVTDTTVFQSTKEAQYAVNGLSQLMAFPMGGNQDGYPCGNVGEAYLMTLWGSAFGQDYFNEHLGMFQGGQLMNLNQFTNTRYGINSQIYGYLYTIVKQANSIIEVIDNVPENAEGERDQIKAEALVYRAHAYVRLLQLWGPRWSDSDNGNRKTIVLRTTSDVGPSPLVPMNDVLDLIYQDCNTAISLFQQEAVAAQPRANVGIPDLSVAYGVLARAALLKNDWATAETAAHNAQIGHEVMSGEQWCSGFMEWNDDYMWSNSVNPDDMLGNASWGSRNACNGHYPVYWQMGAGSMNVDLYRLLDENDIRRTRFMFPDNLRTISASIKDANWWNDRYVDMTTMNIYVDPVKNRSWVMNIMRYGAKMTPAPPSYSDKVVAAYTDITGGNGTPFVQFGAQYKFYVAGGSDQFSQYPYMRSAEMLLTEAEACYEQGKIQQAQELITKLCKKRIEGYTSCTLTGEALRDEIRLQRRIELWGEGVGFFDQKRWGVHLIRRAWVAGDTTSGNVPSTNAMDIAPDQCNHWVVAIPSVEYEYNDMVQENELRW